MADQIVIEEEPGHRIAVLFGKLLVGLVKFMAFSFLVIFPVVGVMFEKSSYIIIGILLCLITLFFAHILKNTLFPRVVRLFFYIAYGHSNVTIDRKK